MENLNKEFKIESPGKFVYAEWHKWDKAADNFLSEKFNLIGTPLSYVVRKDDVPVTTMFYDVAYSVDQEEFCINAAPLSIAVFKRDKVEVHKLLNYLTQGTEAWKWIENSKGGRDAMKSLMEHYDDSSKVKHHMNITKLDLKELYFKH